MSNHALMPLTKQALAYTDGACRGNPGKGGFGAVIILPNGEQLDICGGEDHTTNNRMELMGAIAALENSPADIPIQIWSDSSYVIKGISEWMVGWKNKNWKNVKNVELWQRLDALTQNRQIDWQWVKGHAGHDGNEYADQLANQGIDQLPKTFGKKVTSAANTNSDLEIKKKEKPMSQPLNNSPIDLTATFTDEPDNYNGSLAEQYLADDIFLQALDNEVNHPAEQTINAQQSTAPKSDNPNFTAFTNQAGQFLAQDDHLLAKRPEFNGITSQPNPTFVPLLPIAKHKGAANRQLILDTETTGFEAQGSDRIIEVGIVEMINRRFTGEKLHVYINPLKKMDEEVIRIHGIHNAFLDDMPVFEQVGPLIYEFLQGAELIAHNAVFDMSFLQAEFARLGLPDIASQVTVTDSLAIAKRMYAGQRNTLDALVKRLNVGKQDRTFHGALLDAEILAEVYLAMTGGQVALAIDDEVGGGAGGSNEHQHFHTKVKRFMASAVTEQAHHDWLSALKDKNPQLAENWLNV